MAGQSSKKSKQVHQEKMKLYRSMFLGSQGMYIVGHVVMGDILERSQLLTILIMFVFQYYIINYIDKSLQLGLDIKSYTYYNDIFIVNIVIQLGSLVSGYFWYLYYLVPLYIVYYIVSMVMSYLGSSSGVEDQEEQQPQISKRQMKLQEREKKGKNVKYIG